VTAAVVGEENGLGVNGHGHAPVHANDSLSAVAVPPPDTAAPSARDLSSPLVYQSLLLLLLLLLPVLATLDRVSLSALLSRSLTD
jgi:hypothetical protein